jgi:patatin-like phospholipase/acyl hydrolase
MPYFLFIVGAFALLSQGIECGQTQRSLPPLPGMVQPKSQSPLANSLALKPDAESAESCLQDKNKSPILILSMDGAAIRGVAQFEIIKGIEQSFNNEIIKIRQAESKKSGARNYAPQTDKQNITDIFDFFAGTSAGAASVGSFVIPDNAALANTSPATQGRVKPLYDLETLDALLPETLKASFAGGTFRKIRTLGGLAGSRYTAKDAEALLQKRIGKARMSDTVKPVLITSYDLRSREIMNFSTFEACRLKKSPDENFFMRADSGNEREPVSHKGGFFQKKDAGSTDPLNSAQIRDVNIYLWQAIRAAGSAPVYYKPLGINIGGKERALIDAGLFVMSPALLAWVEAQKQPQFKGRRFVLISISSGTLANDRSVKITGATAGSVPSVLKPTIETAIEGQQILTHEMLQNIPGIIYHRLTFDVENKEFDDYSPENIKAIKAAGIRATQTDEFRAVIKDVVAARVERQAKNDLAPFICAFKEKNIAGTEQAKRYMAGDNSGYAGKKIISYSKLKRGIK